MKNIFYILLILHVVNDYTSLTMVIFENKKINTNIIVFGS